MKAIGLFLTAIFLVTIALPLWAQPHPHPYEAPAINFQGRIEEGDIGYSGDSWFSFRIGNADMTNIYWGPEIAYTLCVEGIYNVILGKDTDPLPAAVFTGQTDYFLEVSFSTNEVHWETLEPVQEILTVPFAVNAHLLDGLTAPQSAFVGLTDIQTIEGKTMLDTILTRPVIDSSYFVITPGTPPSVAEPGYLAFDGVLQYYDGDEWVPVGDTAADSPWYRDGTTIRPRSTGDFVQLTGASRLIFTRAARGTAANPLISLNPEDGGTGIFKLGDHQIDFSTQSARRLSIRSGGQLRFIPQATDPPGGGRGDLYFSYQTDPEPVTTFMYHDGSSWHPIATGEGSIPKPNAQYDTLFATDGTTWEPTRELRIHPHASDGKVATWNDLQVGWTTGTARLYFGTARSTGITNPGGGRLQFFTSGTGIPQVTLTSGGRFQMRASGTVGEPALSFGNQTNLGIYRISANNLGFVTGGERLFALREGGYTVHEPLLVEPTASHAGGLFFNSQSGTFMYAKANDGPWIPIATGEGSIPSPDNQYDTLYAVDDDNWAPTDELTIQPTEYVQTKGDLRVGGHNVTNQRITFASTDTGIVYPGSNLLDFYTNGARKLRIYSTVGGTAANPLIQLSSDTTSGFFRPTADNIAISTSGTEAMRIRANQHVGLGTGSSTSARLHVKETEDQRAFRIDQEAANNAVWIQQAASTGDDAPSDTKGGALHVYAATGAFGSAITAFSNQSAAAPMVWFRGGSSFDRQPVLRLQSAGGKAAPLHLEPMSSAPAPGTIWNNYTGALYVHADGTLYYNNGTEWLALPGDVGVGTVTGSGSVGRVPLWTTTTTNLGDSIISDDGSTITVAGDLVATSAAFTNLTASVVEISGGAIDGTAIGQTTEALGRFSHLTAVDSLTSANLAANRVIYTGTGGLLSVDDDLQFDGNVLTGTAGQFTALTAAAFAVTGGDPAAGQVLAAVDGSGLVEWTAAAAGDITGEGADGRVTYWTGEKTIGSDAGFTFDPTDNQLALTSTATAGDAFAITANDLTSGKALSITANDLTGTAQALRVTSSGEGETGHAMAYLERTAPGRVLQVMGNNPTGATAWFEAQTIGASTATVMTVKANRAVASQYGFSVLYAYQQHNDAAGHALVAHQAGSGDALRSIVTTGSPGGGSAGFFAQRADSGSAVTATTGGAVHIVNTGNLYGGLTLYSAQTHTPAAPLATFRTSESSFDQPILRLRQHTGGSAPHLWLTPVADASFAPATEAAGMLYASATQNNLMYYDGSDWIPLAGGLTGAGTHGRVAFWDTADSLTSDSSFYWDTNNERLGIGTGAPHSRLTVRDSGDSALSIQRVSSTDNHSTGIRFRVSSYTTDPGRYAGAIFFQRTDAHRGSLHFATRSAAGDANVDLDDARMTITKDGEVGIGTTTPMEDALLDVAGQIAIQGGAPGAGKVLTSVDASGLATWQDAAGGEVTGSGTVGRVPLWTDSTTNLGDSIIIESSDKITIDGALEAAGITDSELTPGSVVFAGAGGLLSEDNDNFFWDSTNERLGIRTDSPTIPLDILGSNLSGTPAEENILRIASTSANPLELRMGLGTSATADNRFGYIDAYDGGTPAGPRHLVFQKDGGNVGIGTTRPINSLHILKDDTLPLTLESSYTALTGHVTGLDFRIAAVSGENYRKGGIIFERTGTGGRGSIHLATNNESGTANVSKDDARLTVRSTGNVGIGHTSPVSRLEVYRDADSGAGRTLRVRNMADIEDADAMLVRTVNQESNIAHFVSGPEEDTNSVLMIKADGRVGVLRDDPPEAFSVNGRMWMNQTDAPATTTNRLYNVAGDLHWDGQVIDGRWTYRTGTRTGNDSFEADTPAAFTPGTPVRYSNDGSDWSYGMVVAVNGNEVTLAGAPMANEMDAFVQTGRPEMLRQVNFYKPGAVEAISDYMGLATWQMAQGYVVRVTGQLESAGDDPVEIQVKVNGNGLIDGTLDLPDTDEWDSNTSINTTHYNIGFGHRIEVDLEDDGGATPGAGLLVTMQVITP